MRRCDRLGNEVDAFAKYLANGGQIHYFGNGDGVREFAGVFHPQYMHVDDAPDFFFAKDDLVILFEHFEFDCYKSTRKGSDHRRELARIQRKEATVLPTEKGVSFHEAIHGRSSYEDYISNVTRSFNEHYSHIDQYINNLRNKGIISDCTKVKCQML